MKVIKKLLLVCIGISLFTACSTDDVEGSSIIDPTPVEPFEIPDVAFAEYLIYREVPGVFSEIQDNQVRYFLNPAEVVVVNELVLSKISSEVQNLTNAGVATAETKITDLTGIEYFIGLQRLVLTSNNLQSLDVSSLTGLQELEMNFNLVGNLDLSSNTALTRLRYRASAQAEDSQKLASIDLSNNTALRHLFLTNHNLETIDLSNNPLIDQLLDLSGNPGPDGNTDTADIVVPAAVFNQLAPENRLGVISDADVAITVFLSANPSTIAESSQSSTTLTVSLNVTASEAVSVELVFGGSATLGEDYTVENTTLTILPGETQASTLVTALDDNAIEGEENIQVTLGQVTNATAGENQQVTITIEDDDIEINLLLNEILYDPSNNGLDGDANGDGVYAQNEDEFIELYNNSSLPLDVSGFEVYDTEALNDGIPRHVIPDGTVIPANSALVIFGGGTPTGDFGGSLVQTSTTGDMNLNNAGDILSILDPNGVVIITFDIEPLSNNPNESFTRSPDVEGDFARHSDVSTTLFSPGTKLDGSSF